LNNVTNDHDQTYNIFMTTIYGRWFYRSYDFTVVFPIECVI